MEFGSVQKILLCTDKKEITEKYKSNIQEDGSCRERIEIARNEIFNCLERRGRGTYMCIYYRSWFQAI